MASVAFLRASSLAYSNRRARSSSSSLMRSIVDFSAARIPPGRYWCRIKQKDARKRLNDQKNDDYERVLRDVQSRINGLVNGPTEMYRARQESARQPEVFGQNVHQSGQLQLMATPIYMNEGGL